MIGDVTGRKFGIKEVEMLGCTLMGANLLAMMASFPTIQRRINDWQEYVAKSNIVIDAILDIKGTNA